MTPRGSARSPGAAVLDACVLFPGTLCDILLRLAETGIYRPRWSDAILGELERNLAERIGEERAGRRVGQMRDAFPEATITGYEALIPLIENDPKDQHVLAAAVAEGSPVIVTDNVTDFPPAAVVSLGIAVQTADQFLLDLYVADPTLVQDVLDRQAQAYRNPPTTFDELLERLARHVPTLFHRIKTDPMIDVL